MDFWRKTYQTARQRLQKPSAFYEPGHKIFEKTKFRPIGFDLKRDTIETFPNLPKNSGLAGEDAHNVVYNKSR